MKAAIYTRVSTSAQADEDKTSLAEQERLCREFCERQGWSVANVYCDGGISGETIDERPAMRDLLIGAAGGAFDIVVAYHQDRLGRSMDSFAQIAGVLKAAAVKVATPGGIIDLTMPADRFTFNIFAAVAEYEKDRIKERMARGREGKARQGGFPHFVRCYGFAWQKADKENGRPARPVIVESEAEVARTIFRLAAAGHPIAEICQTLNAKGAERRGSKRYPRGTWWPAEVNKMLRNPAYMGRFVTYTDPETGEETLARPDLCPSAIVDIATWQAAQAVKGPNGRRRRKVKRDFLLSQFVICGRCKRPMGVRQPTERHNYYVCDHIRHGDCEGNHIPSRDLDAEVWQDIKQLATHPEVLREAARDTREEALPRWRRELVRCGEEMKRWQGRMREARELLERSDVPAYTGEDFAATKAEHDAHMTDLRADCERLEAQIGEAEASQERVDWTVRTLEAAGDLDALDLQAKRRLLAELRVKVEVTTFANERGALIGWTADLETDAAAVLALAEQKGMA